MADEFKIPEEIKLEVDSDLSTSNPFAATEIQFVTTRNEVLGGLEGPLAPPTLDAADLESRLSEEIEARRNGPIPSRMQEYEVLNVERLKEIAEKVYGSGDRKYTELLRRWNLIKFYEYKSVAETSAEGQVTQRYVERINERIPPLLESDGTDVSWVAKGQILFTPTPTEENLRRPDPVPIPTLDYEFDQIRIRTAFNEFRALRTEEQRYIPDKNGFALVLLRRNKTAGYIEQLEYIQDTVTKWVSHASLFEGVRGFEFEVPVEGVDFLLKWRVGDYVMATYDRKVIFMGVLVKPKPKTKGGKTITWTAQSHSCVFVRSHMNPQYFQAGWTSLTPLQIIAELADSLSLPLEISPYAVSELSRQIPDQEQLSEISSDITTTTPFSFINRLAKSAGFNVTSSAFGNFVIEEVRTDDEKFWDYIEGEDLVVSADYDYGDVARTYTVLSQRREANEYGSYVFYPYPAQMQVFKNSTTDLSVASTLEEAAEFEAARQLTDALTITMQTPTLIDKTGTPWSLGRKVGVQSSTCLLYRNPTGEASDRRPIEMLTSGVDITWTEKEQIANITLAFPWSFLPLVRRLQGDIPAEMTPQVGWLSSLSREELSYYGSTYERLPLLLPQELPFLNFNQK